MIAFMAITDGRADYLERTIQSFQENVDSIHFGRRLLVNDNPGVQWCNWLDNAWPGNTFEHIIHPTEGRRGFAGAIQAGWEWINDCGAQWVFHLEDDFVFNCKVDVTAMRRVLQSRPDIAQLVLKRQPWNSTEISKGGIVEIAPKHYTEEKVGVQTITTHKQFWSTNPCLYSADWCEHGWPDPPDSERKWTDYVLENSDSKLAFVGGKFDPPLVHHIGYERAGHGY